MEQLGRLVEEQRRQCQAQSLGGLAINDKRKLPGPLHRQVRWLGAFQDTIYVVGRPAEHGLEARPIGHQTPLDDKYPRFAHRWELMCGEERHEGRLVLDKERGRYLEQRLGSPRFGGGDGAGEVGRLPHFLDVQLEPQRLGRILHRAYNTGHRTHAHTGSMPEDRHAGELGDGSSGAARAVWRRVPCLETPAR